METANPIKKGKISTMLSTGVPMKPTTPRTTIIELIAANTGTTTPQTERNAIIRIIIDKSIAKPITLDLSPAKYCRFSKLITGIPTALGLSSLYLS